MIEFFKPSVALINKLKYRQKLMLLGSIVVLIVIALMYEVTEQAATQIQFSRKELTGIDVTNHLVALMRQIENYKTIRNFLSNNLSTEEELRNARVSVDKSILNVAEVIEKVKPRLNTVEQWEQIKNEWDMIKQNPENRFSFGRGVDIIQNIQKLVVTTCDATNLTLDPQIDSYYLVDLYCTILPRTIENIENIQDLSVASLYQKNISDIDLSYLYVMTTLAQRFSLPSIKDNLGKAITYNKSLLETFSSMIEVIDQDTNQALNAVNNNIFNKKFNYPIEEFNNFFVSWKENLDLLYETTAQSIKKIINQRIKKLRRDFFINLCIVFIGLVLFIYLFIGIYLSIIQSIRKLVSSSDEIAKGNLQAKVSLQTQDELSQVADSFNTMRETLQNIVSELHDVVTAVGKGDLKQRVNLTNKQGFSKELSSNINEMTDVFQDMMQDIITVLDFISKGNLTIRVTREYHGLFAELKNYVNNTIDNLEKLIKSIKNSTETIRNAAEEISLGNIDLEKRTEQQAASLEQTSVSMSKMTETVQQNTENAKEAHGYVQVASNTALESGNVVNQVVVMMNAINESARQITEITNVIDSIAFQTNILALNAAVEAARAGEQGRGFSVVASEIRNLAQRSSVSAQGIKTLINSSVEQIIQGKKLADEAGKTMQQVVESVKNVTSTMSEIVDASVEQTHGIQQINVAITQMDQVTQQNSALVEEATRSSEALKKQTEQMNVLVNLFKISADETHRDEEVKLPPDQTRELDNQDIVTPDTLADTTHETESTKKKKNEKELKPDNSSESSSSAPPFPKVKEDPDEWTEF